MLSKLNCVQILRMSQTSPIKVPVDYFVVILTHSKSINQIFKYPLAKKGEIETYVIGAQTSQQHG